MAEIKMEKVIKGLELCKQDAKLCFSETECPYQCEFPRCCLKLMADALELLKEQEPKLLKPEEFAGSLDYVWVETRVSDNRSGLFVADICLASDAINYELQMCGQSDRPILEHSQLGKRWRCWDKKPTEAQMRAVKWDV